MVRRLAENLGTARPEPQKPTPPAKPEPKPEPKIEKTEKAIPASCECTDESIAAVFELVGLTEDALEKMYCLFKPNSGTKADYLLFAARLLTDFNAERLAEVVLGKMRAFENEGLLKKA
jgi:hypothetical protein